ncbi:hypothetical protein [Enterococcus sp. AZ102]|uniref:hypothetical protein n=1 Tax=Enterococcus sp. AZ102 TaxID=2774865 RepID=UPI003F290A11
MKYKDLEYNDKQQIANLFCSYLMQYTSDYFISEESLRSEFKELFDQEFFGNLVEWFEQKYEIFGIKVLCDVNRFKLCSECKRVFISVDKSNKNKRCSYELYRKFSMSTRRKFEMDRSECWVQANRKKANRYYQKTKVVM